jgi:hypothetical protein
MTRSRAGSGGSGRPSADRLDTATEPDSERTPLLAGTPTPSTTTTLYTNNNDSDYDDAPGAAADPDLDPDRLTRLRSLLRPRVLILSVALVFLLELAVGIALPPTNAIMESIICRQMHPDVFLPSPGPGIAPPPPPLSSLSPARAAAPSLRHFAGGVVLSDDPVCKSPDVQGYLAMLRGWAATFEAVPGIVGAVPYGVLSDRWGRRPLIGLSLAGTVLSQAFTYLVCKRARFCWWVGYRKGSG